MRSRRREEDPEATQVLDAARGDLPAIATYEGDRHGEGLRVAVVASRFNVDITDALLAATHESLIACGVEAGSISLAWVPGAFELPLVAHRLASSGEFDAVICLGAVVRGETDHYAYVAGECAAGIQRAQLDTGIPVVFGVLTTNTVEDAVDRAGGRLGNVGHEAAFAAVEMADLLRQLPEPRPRT